MAAVPWGAWPRRRTTTRYPSAAPAATSAGGRVGHPARIPTAAPTATTCGTAIATSASRRSSTNSPSTLPATPIDPATSSVGHENTSRPQTVGSRSTSVSRSGGADPGGGAETAPISSSTSRVPASGAGAFDAGATPVAGDVAGDGAASAANDGRVPIHPTHISRTIAPTRPTPAGRCRSGEGRPRDAESPIALCTR